MNVHVQIFNHYILWFIEQITIFLKFEIDDKTSVLSCSALFFAYGFRKVILQADRFMTGAASTCRNTHALQFLLIHRTNWMLGLFHNPPLSQ